MALGIGIIGCGNISDIYLRNMARFPVLRPVACADLNMAAAEAKAAAHGLRALTVAALLADPGVDIVLNLTVPLAHAGVGRQVLAAGKHLYAEKPLGVTLAEGAALVAAADAAGLRLGSAPDTFLGGAHQTALAALAAGRIGAVVAGSAHMMVAGHERWHPNPDFYYQPGGGPMLDMGPYYLTVLIAALGPVAAVTGAAARPRATRTIGSGARAGQQVPVLVDTHITGILDFAQGAQITLTTSFDVTAHGHAHIELYGTTGSMVLADPNCFDGAVRVAHAQGRWEDLPQAHGYGSENWRALGLADMAQAILDGRPHRASGALALHVLEVMEGIQTSARDGRRITMAHPCPPPATMPAGLAPGDIF